MSSQKGTRAELKATAGNARFSKSTSTPDPDATTPLLPIVMLPAARIEFPTVVVTFASPSSLRFKAVPVPEMSTNRLGSFVWVNGGLTIASAVPRTANRPEPSWISESVTSSSLPSAESPTWASSAALR